ncbi:hypothetical protein Z517_10534 [Fonsecaea pedrosoi CBS 271.37]|uniref:Uncharacterized protein n=1 Tax=Fonsecaea pedrosoi CBS 271.37 TaxID=1442368 RepID=A0A0D2DDN8_9EURO|nr:uncharacterized protein Z517_10534 [Fonsecaea pedrosoi CBS 271.37]KIW75791.1 hypothetical protein Z517_10534 [Fonsecaea pedrosoi CBS 271.37]
MADRTPPSTQGYDRVEFYSCETSVARIERDRRDLLTSNRFRILIVKCPQPSDGPSLIESSSSSDSSSPAKSALTKSKPSDDHELEDDPLYNQDQILQVARNNGWIDEHFDSYIKNNTASSAVFDSPESIRLIAQSPKDDGFPFFSLAFTQRFSETRQYDSDWECLVFFRPAGLWDNQVGPLLTRNPFPHDYPEPLQPDFMVLPVTLLRWQVDDIINELNKTKKSLMNHDRGFGSKPVPELKNIKKVLFELRQKNFFLRHRRDFAREFAETLLETFRAIERRHSSPDETPVYSPSMIARVASQQAMLKSVERDLETTASRIESQLDFVSLKDASIVSHLRTYFKRQADGQMREAFARRDSTSMKVIAVVTVIFLPATFIATIFSMGIFDWHAGQPDDDTTIVSSWLWLYFVLSIVLTAIIVVVWKLASKRIERKLAKESEEKWEGKWP